MATTALTPREERIVSDAYQDAPTAQTAALIAIIRRLDEQIEEMGYETQNQAAIDSLD